MRQPGQTQTGGFGWDTERGVAPVIGVVLLVAVVLILATSVGMFLFATVGGTEETPKVSTEFNYDASSGQLVITHGGGDTLDEGTFRIVSDEPGYTTGALSLDSSKKTASGPPSQVGTLSLDSSKKTASGPPFQAGDRLFADYGAAQRGDEVSVVWTGPDGDSAILGSYRMKEGTPFSESTTLISGWSDLETVRNNLDGDYVLAEDLDGDNLDGDNNGKGFKPIGDNSNKFTGTFDGQGNTIEGLKIYRPGESDVGLFGETDSSAEIRNVRLTDVNITGGTPVGGLIGTNRGTVEDSSVEGSVTGTESYGAIGGLTGYNSGTIEDSSATAKVEGIQRVGGLVGQNSMDTAMISESSAQGDVTGDSKVGGLVGRNSGATIEKSYATGNVTGVDKGSYQQSVGGFVGSHDDGTISESYATGTVSAPNTEWVGGFAGGNIAPIKRSYATGSATGGDVVGGFIGSSQEVNSEVYATGSVTGDSDVGGLVGHLQGENHNRKGILKNSYFDNSTSGTGQTDAVGEFNPYGNKPEGEKRGDVAGVDTAQMQGETASTTLSGFDFSGTWATVTSPDDYPVLRWQTD